MTAASFVLFMTVYDTLIIIFFNYINFFELFYGEVQTILCCQVVLLFHESMTFKMCCQLALAF